MKKILITFLCLPFIMFAQNSDKKSSQEEFPTIEIKDEMPNMDYEMKSVNGISYSLNNLKEKNGIIILFTCNTCPFVVKWEDRYKLLEELAKKNNIGFAYVNSNFKKRDGDDSFEEMKKHAKKMNYRFPYLLDEKSKLANSFGAKTTPHIFMFNSNHQLVYKGAIDDNYEDIDKVKEFYLEDAIEQLVKGKRIKVSETMPVGCSIKRYKP